MTIAALISVIEQFADPSLQEDYDNAGLITGQPQWSCTGALCTLDVTEEVVREAIDRNCNLIVAHHPIIFKGLKRINGKNYVERVVIEAIRNGIAIYAAHTNLDNVGNGVSAVMAAKLGLQQTTVLQPRSGFLRKLVTFAPVDKAEAVRDALFAAGAGQIGNYSECSFSGEGMGSFKAGPGADPYVGAIGSRHYEPEQRIEVIYPAYREKAIVQALLHHHPYEEVAYDLFSLNNSHPGTGAGIIGELPLEMDEEDFLALVRRTFGASGIRHTALLGKPVHRVALCGGAGSFLIKTAAEAGADCYITSDIKYHEFFDAEGRLLVADIGHYESEQFTTGLLHDLLREKFPNFAILQSKVNTNPVHYLGKADS